MSCSYSANRDPTGHNLVRSQLTVGSPIREDETGAERSRQVEAADS